MKQKKRLDERLLELHPQLSRTQVQSYIMQGKVMLDGVPCTKPGKQVTEESEILFSYEEPRYVSRAGFKLEKALDEFSVDPKGLIVLDAGLSTGGFTDCLLQRGAQKVYGIDVGYGQVHDKIRNDPRVMVMERTNLRDLNNLPQKVDLVTLDLSFISVIKVIPAVKKLMTAQAQLIVLIKPQFEAERHEVGRGGIIKDPEIHQKVVQKVLNALSQEGFVNKGIIESPILGAEGNKEFLGYFINKEI